MRSRAGSRPRSSSTGGGRTRSCWNCSRRAPAPGSAAAEHRQSAMAYTTRQERCPLGSIETWIFDLDNTLYPASCHLFEQVQQRMNEYICERLSVSPDQAAAL